MRATPYRWLWGTVLAGSSGRYAVLLVTGWLAFRLTHSPLGPGIVSFLAFCPALIVGPVSGALADRIDRRLLIWAGVGITGSTCVLGAALAASHRLGLPAVLVVAAAAGVGLSLEQPSRVSLVPLIVGPEQLLNAFSLMRIPMQGSEFVGPAIVTVILERYGPAPALAACAVFYALAAAQVLFIAVHPAGGAPAPKESGLRADIRDALAYVVRERLLGALLLFVSAHCALTMAFMGILPGLASTVLGGGPGIYGMLMIAVGLGAVAGPLGLACGARRANERRLLVVTGVLSGIALAGLGLSRTAGEAAVMAASAGAAQSLFMVLIYSQTQTLAAAAMRGRVASFAFFFTSGVMGIFNMLLAAAAGAVGAPAVLVASGLLFVAATAVFLIRVPELQWIPPVTAAAVSQD